MKIKVSLLSAILACLAGSSVCCAADDAHSSYNYRDQQQWDRFTFSEQTDFGSRGTRDRVPERVRQQQMKDAADRERERERGERSVSMGNFQVPSWVVTQAPVYQRPVEIVGAGGQAGFDNTNPSTSFRTTVPYTGSWLGVPAFAGSWYSPARSYAGWSGYGGYGGYGWAAPNLGATLGLPGAARAFSAIGGLAGLGYGGWGGLGYGGWGGLGYGGWGGLGYGGWGGLGYGGWGGLGYGGWGGLGYGGWGGLGYGGWSPASAALGFRRGAICDPGGSVYQSAPSKASGNYYQPSTVDPTASGSYYASGSATPIQVGPSEPPPKDYWGPDGNPFKQQTP